MDEEETSSSSSSSRSSSSSSTRSSSSSSTFSSSSSSTFSSSSSSTRSSSLSSSGPIIDGCCDLGSSLSAAITDKTGSASGMPSSLTLTKIGGQWVSGTFSLCGGTPSEAMILSCQNNTWALAVNYATSIVLVTANCSTKTVVFDVAYNNGMGCSGSFRVTIQG